MKALVDAGAKPDLKAADGMSANLAAAYSGNLAAVKYALELDPNLTETAQGGKSIMHMAVANRLSPQWEEVITYLTDKGAKLDAKDDRGGTPGDFVNRTGPEKIRVFYIQLLKDHNVTPSTAH